MSLASVTRPADVATALTQWRAARSQGLDVAWLAGGQSLLAAMRLGMSTPAVLIDLQDVASMRGIRRLDDGQLEMGASCTHDEIANSPIVRGFSPGLARLAGNIADQQVRNMGTIGGSLANHDPAACWPPAVLACQATLVTSEREIPADAFFTGLFGTALFEGELLLAIRMAGPLQFEYQKIEQPASRFALVGLAIARLAGTDGVAAVRVAVNGLGEGVCLWPEAQGALSKDWELEALRDLQLPPERALADLHASAEYRAHLAGVLCRRLALQMGAKPGELRVADPRSPAASPVTQSAPAVKRLAEVEGGFGGTVRLPAGPPEVWRALLDTGVLRACVPGCESIETLENNRYRVRLKVGIGPLSARFAGEIALNNLQPHERMTLAFSGSAGPLGGGRGETLVKLAAEGPDTVLSWRAQVETSGRIAQLGQRLVEGSARRLSGEFFASFSQALGKDLSGDATGRQQAGSVHVDSVSKRWFHALTAWWRRLFKKEGR